MDRLLEDMFLDQELLEKTVNIGSDKGLRAEATKLQDPHFRAEWYQRIRDDMYEIMPPHAALIPKDNGEFRTVYINEPLDRLFLSLANNLLFKHCHSMVHDRCTSYQHGIGCGKVVLEVVAKSKQTKTKEIGYKSDLSKYFDTVPVRYIDKAFDDAEKIVGHSAVIDVLRKFYHNDYYFDTDGNLCKEYKSLKQGVATASWLADVVLYEVDDAMSKSDIYYVRYSDDTLIIGDNYKEAFDLFSRKLNEMQLGLNPKKVELLTKDKAFKFLGFSIRGNEISLSKSRIKTFQKEIEKRTIRSKNSFKCSLNAVNRYLYGGEYSWATSVLPIINVKEDINTLNEFVMDCLRAVSSNRRKVGGLGYEIGKKTGMITRGKGRNVSANRQKMLQIDGYKSIGLMRNALFASRSAYETLVRTL